MKQPQPKYKMKTGLRNYMQITSMKITESGAKDLMNSQPMNKVRKLKTFGIQFSPVGRIVRSTS